MPSRRDFLESAGTSRDVGVVDSKGNPWLLRKGFPLWEAVFSYLPQALAIVLIILGVGVIIGTASDNMVNKPFSTLYGWFMSYDDFGAFNDIHEAFVKMNAGDFGTGFVGVFEFLWAILKILYADVAWFFNLIGLIF